jgi:hypothetical protein
MIERGEKEELYVLIRVRALSNVATGLPELKPVAASLPII